MPPPLTVYVIFVIAVLIQGDWIFVPAPEVSVITALGLIVRSAAPDLKGQPPWPGGVFISTLKRYPSNERGAGFIVRVFVLKPE